MAKYYTTKFLNVVQANDDSANLNNFLTFLFFEEIMNIVYEVFSKQGEYETSFSY